MNEIDVRPATPQTPSRRRWPRRIAIALLASVFLGGVAFLLILYLADREWREAVAEAERLDPGWKFEDLQARRADIPDEENAALCVKKAHGLLPESWWPPKQTNPFVAGEALDKSLRELPPTARLTQQQIEALTTALAAAEPALVEARRLKDLPKGRYPLAADPNGWLSSHPAGPNARQVAVLLGYDVLLREQAGDMNGALESCRALVNLARSCGDDPEFVTQLTRIELRSDALRRIERTLAQGPATAASLAALQSLLEDEEAQPLFLFGARGFRASFHQLLEAASAGELKEKGGSFWAPALAGNIRAPTLRATTHLVEIAKLPVEQQERELREHGLPKRNEGRYLARIYIWPKIEKVTADLSHGQLRTQAELRCAITALAAERYRLAKGAWPASLAAMVPAFLPAVPIDPFDGQPARYRRLADGVVIYCVGPDRKDDGGNLDRGNTGVAGTDVGMQLWDTDMRRPAP
jgi:hypothetical protein